MIDVGYKLTSTNHCRKAIREASKEPCLQVNRMMHMKSLHDSIINWKWDQWDCEIIEIS